MTRTEDDVAIHVRNLSKRFEIYSKPTDLVWEVLTRRPRHRPFWALLEVSFDLHRGEVVGIVGRNGAGKSTLLKILAGTLEKTEGQVRVNGRISSILELGTGFQPEHSGRHNIFMGGLCLGMSRQEIDAKLDRIIEFSELRDYIDQPLKTYSTGMHARLAFSVAISVDPDILIVDEALSVGDAKFQRKCYAKFDEFRKTGCTILFVTHATNIIEAICDRAIYLTGGRVAADGKPKMVTGLYMRDLFGPQESESEAAAAPPLEAGHAELRYGNRGAEIIDFGILGAKDHRVTQLQTGRRYTIFCKVRCQREIIDDLNTGISVTTKEGVLLFAINPILQRVRTPVLQRGDILDVRLDVTMWLGPGDYFLTFGAWGLHENTHYDRRVDALHFTVQGDYSLSASLVNLTPRYHMSVVSVPDASERVG